MNEATGAAYEASEAVDLTHGIYRRIFAGYLKGQRINQLSLAAEAWFWRLLVTVDEFGNGEAEGELCRQATAGRRIGVTGEQIEGWLEEMRAAGLIEFYQVRGERFFHLVGFEDWQPPNGRNGRRVKRFPAPGEVTRAEAVTAATQSAQSASATVEKSGAAVENSPVVHLGASRCKSVQFGDERTPMHYYHYDQDQDQDHDQDQDQISLDLKNNQGRAPASAAVTSQQEPAPRKKAKRARSSVGSSGRQPAIAAVRQVTGRYPPRAIWESLTSTIGEHPDVERLKRCWQIWRTRGYNPQNFAWALEWYAHGQASEQRPKRAPPSSTSTAPAPARSLNENRNHDRPVCLRCFDTGTEITSEGARRCDHRWQQLELLSA